MIYTLTMNPSIDYVIRFDDLQKGCINRCKEEDYVFGGKGINVSLMLDHLGMKSCALGFIAGFTGEALQQGLQAQGIQTDFIRVEDGFTRINVKIHAQEETELNGQGPMVSKQHLALFYQKLEQFQDGDILVLSGSIARQVDASIYATIMEKLQKKNILVIVDASGEALLQTLPYHPFLIKPNHHELQELCQLADTKEETLLHGALQLQAKGARNVLVSMAEKGALLVDEQQGVHRIEGITGEVINSVGAGDSMGAGFLYGYASTKDYHVALEYGISCGSASAFDKGIASKEDVLRILEEVQKR